MELIAIVKIALLVASLTTFVLSLIFLFSPELYFRLEDRLNSDIISRVEFLTVVEGKVNVINDWIFENRIIFGTLFVLLSLYNVKSLLLL